jgi:tetratricopeptide (TPR) repeat protein
MMPLENELLSQGLKRLQAADYEEALKLFEQAIAQNPQQTDAFYQRSLRLQKQWRYSDAAKRANKKFLISLEALKKVNRTPELNTPKLLFFAETWFNKGNQELGLGNFGCAVEMYDKALRLKPG